MVNSKTKKQAGVHHFKHYERNHIVKQVHITSKSKINVKLLKYCYKQTIVCEANLHVNIISTAEMVWTDVGNTRTVPENVKEAERKGSMFLTSWKLWKNTHWNRDPCN